MSTGGSGPTGSHGGGGVVSRGVPQIGPPRHFLSSIASPPSYTPPLTSPGPTLPPLPQTACGGVLGGGPPSTRTTAERNGSTSGPAGGVTGDSPITLHSRKPSLNMEKNSEHHSISHRGASVSPPPQPNPLNCFFVRMKMGDKCSFFP